MSQFRTVSAQSALKDLRRIGDARSSRHSAAQFTQVFAMLCLLLSPLAALADGSLTVGNKVFTLRTTDVDAEGNADFTLAGEDQLHHLWWWYGQSGLTREQRLPTPDTESYNGNEAVLTWNSVNGEFSAVWTLTLSGTDDDAGLLESHLELTGLPGTFVDYTFFNYVDIDVGDNDVDDSAEYLYGAGGYIEVQDGIKGAYVNGPFVNTGEFPQKTEVAAHPSLLDRLDDDEPTSIVESGVPFVGDLTAAHAWDVLLFDGTSTELGTGLGAVGVVRPLAHCPLMTTTDLLGGQSTTTGLLEMAFLDPAVGGLGGEIRFDVDVPATADALLYNLDTADDSIADPDDGPFEVSFSTATDAAPDPDLLASEGEVTFFAELLPGTNVPIFPGTSCQVQLSFKRAQCQIELEPTEPVQGQPFAVNVRMRDVRGDLIAPPADVFGTLMSDSANWGGDIDLGSAPDAVIGRTLVYDSVYSVAEFDPGDHGEYTLFVVGAGSSGAEGVTCKAATDTFFDSSFDSGL